MFQVGSKMRTASRYARPVDWQWEIGCLTIAQNDESAARKSHYQEAKKALCEMTFVQLLNESSLNANRKFVTVVLAFQS